MTGRAPELYFHRNIWHRPRVAKWGKEGQTSETHSFGYWVRRRRKALDLTQAELAQHVGCAEVTIRRIEADERRPSRQMADRLAEQLQIAADERETFLKAARAELAADRLPTPAPPLAAPPTPPVAPALQYPSGTVTFLFTDIESSTRLWEQQKDAMPAALTRHDAILRQAIAAHNGVVFKTVGDAVCAAFASAPDALAAALDAQRALQAESWATIQSTIYNLQSAIELRVRMALHTGTAALQDGEYRGLALSRVARILAAGHGGQILVSQSTQELVRNHLPLGAELRDLGAHQLKDLSRPERIFQAIAPGLLAVFPPLNTLGSRRTNLPAQPTPLIGRDQEVATVCALLRRPDVCLVTLTGPGGTGKTRLSLQAAAELLDDPSPLLAPRSPPHPPPPSPARREGEQADSIEPGLPLSRGWERGSGGEGLFPDGVCFVNLAPIGDSSLVASTVAQALGVRETAGRSPQERVTEYVRDKRLLLLLDNFEQVLDAGLLVADLLMACPHLKVLVTSREILHLRGEKEFAVPPLALPPKVPLSPAWERGTGGEGELTQYAAVQLFIARAQDVRPDFAVTNANAPAVAEICHRLDGLPLAIELAAARVKLFSPEALLVRLEHRLQVLTGGPHDLPARQQTLRNTIDWSYNLLNEEEQALFRRLGVFVGGCTLEAAEAVLRTEDRGLSEESPVSVLRPQPSVLDGLASLVDKSLLKQVDGPDGGARFLMLETVCEYALERLEESGEATALRRRHASYYLVLAERASSALWGSDALVWLYRLDQEIDNLRAVFDWSLVAVDTADVGVRLAETLTGFWARRDHQHEIRTWLGRILSMSHHPAKQARAAALSMAANLESVYGDSARARTLSDEGIALYRELGDQVALAWALVFAGRIARNRGDYLHAAVLGEEGLRLYHEQGNRREIKWAFYSLGDVALDQGDLTGAAERFQQALALAQEQGNEHEVGLALNCLGQVAYAQNDTIRAETLLTQALALRQNLGERGGISMTLFELGRVAHRQGDAARATALFAESLVLSQELGSKWGLADALDGLATIAGEDAQPERAARLFGAAEALRESIGHPLPPIMRTEYEAAVASTRAQLHEPAFVAAWFAGRTMTVEQAVAYALDQEP